MNRNQANHTNATEQIRIDHPQKFIETKCNINETYQDKKHFTKLDKKEIQEKEIQEKGNSLSLWGLGSCASNTVSCIAVSLFILLAFIFTLLLIFASFMRVYTDTLNGIDKTAKIIHTALVIPQNVLDRVDDYLNGHHLMAYDNTEYKQIWDNLSIDQLDKIQLVMGSCTPYDSDNEVDKKIPNKDEIPNWFKLQFDDLLKSPSPTIAQLRREKYQHGDGWSKVAIFAIKPIGEIDGEDRYKLLVACKQNKFKLEYKSLWGKSFYGKPPPSINIGGRDYDVKDVAHEKYKVDLVRKILEEYPDNDLVKMGNVEANTKDHKKGDKVIALDDDKDDL